LDLLLGDLFAEPLGSAGVFCSGFGRLDHLLGHLDVDFVDFTLNLPFLSLLVLQITIKLVHFLLQSALLFVQV
jgi:hypothetical protein